MVMDCLLLVRCCIKHASMTCRSSQKSPVFNDSSRSLWARCAAYTFQLSRMSPRRACLLLLFELTPCLRSKFVSHTFQDDSSEMLMLFFFCLLLLENARSKWNLWPRFKKKNVDKQSKNMFHLFSHANWSNQLLLKLLCWSKYPCRVFLKNWPSSSVKIFAFVLLYTHFSIDKSQTFSWGRCVSAGSSQPLLPGATDETPPSTPLFPPIKYTYNRIHWFVFPVSKITPSSELSA